MFPECPVRNVLSRIMDKWTLLVLYTLESDGFVARKVIPAVPVKVEYTLTEAVGKMNVGKLDRSRLSGNFVSKEQPSIIDDPSIKSGFYGAIAKENGLWLQTCATRENYEQFGIRPPGTKVRIIFEMFCWYQPG